MSYKLTIVLDNVRSAFNVGSIFRTSDGLGASIELIGITPIPGKEKKLNKTSLSALESVSWKHFNTREEWLNSLARDKAFIISVEEGDFNETVSLYGLEEKLGNNISDKNVYIVFGHELNGVNPYLIENSDLLVTIPMCGSKNSLNVGTCVGILGYRVLEILKRY